MRPTNCPECKTDNLYLTRIVKTWKGEDLSPLSLMPTNEEHYYGCTNCQAGVMITMESESLNPTYKE